MISAIRILLLLGQLRLIAYPERDNPYTPFPNSSAKAGSIHNETLVSFDG